MNGVTLTLYHLRWCEGYFVRLFDMPDKHEWSDFDLVSFKVMWGLFCAIVWHAWQCTCCWMSLLSIISSRPMGLLFSEKFLKIHLISTAFKKMFESVNLTYFSCFKRKTSELWQFQIVHLKYTWEPVWPIVHCQTDRHLITRKMRWHPSIAHTYITGNLSFTINSSDTNIQLPRNHFQTLLFYRYHWLCVGYQIWQTISV